MEANYRYSCRSSSSSTPEAVVLCISLSTDAAGHLLRTHGNVGARGSHQGGQDA
jgi:hypothetical protein